MSKYRKKPFVITAITFAELVAHGIAQCKAEGRESGVINGMPWAFEYNGQPITHESDTCYIIPTLEGAMKMGPDDMLITGVAGEVYPCKREIFEATYDKEPEASKLPPHQQRVLDEKLDLDIRITKLDEFIHRNQLFNNLPTDEKARLKRQYDVMHELSVILADRIQAF